MSYHVNRRWGDSEDNPTVERMREALADLDVDDIEHPDVALIHDSGWCLSAFPRSLLIWEYVGIKINTYPRGSEYLSMGLKNLAQH